jgi:hypothetical protein
MLLIIPIHLWLTWVTRIEFPLGRDFNLITPIKSLSFIAICGLLIVGSPRFSLAQSPNDIIVKIANSENIVRVQSTGSEGWLDIESGYSLSSSDKIKVLENSSAEISVISGITISIGSSSIIGFDDQLAFGILTLEQGQIVFTSENTHNSKKTIDSQVAEISFNECRAKMIVGEDGTTEVKLYDGQLHLTTIPQNDTTSIDSLKTETQIIEPKTLNLKAMEKVIITSHGSIVCHVEFSLDDIDELDQQTEQ